MIARAALALVLVGAFAGPAAAAPRTPIKHFVVLMQENHSFDNYFGTFRGANGIPAQHLHARRARSPALRSAVSPRRAGSTRSDLAHEAGSHRMDGFIRAASS